MTSVSENECFINNKSNTDYDIDFRINREYDNRLDNIITQQSGKYITTEKNSSNKHIYSDGSIKDQNLIETTSNIYRFKFTEYFTNELAIFSKVHQYDERKDFKEAWKLWMEENSDIVSEEITRLRQIGFIGDIEDKMFKSARYYFRKKTDEKKEPKQRRQYISVNRQLLDAMDTHIEENPDLQPKIGFSDFCKEYEDIVKEELAKMIETGLTDIDVIRDKIKKTYKNRYFRCMKIK